jgi:hypothetical protein
MQDLLQKQANAITDTRINPTFEDKSNPSNKITNLGSISSNISIISDSIKEIPKLIRDDTNSTQIESDKLDKFNNQHIAELKKILIAVEKISLQPHYISDTKESNISLQPKVLSVKDKFKSIIGISKKINRYDNSIIKNIVPNISPKYKDRLTENTNLAVNPVAVNPVAVNPVAVNPVAVNPVAVNPVAVNPVAVNPVAVNPVAVNPVAVNPTVNPVAINPTVNPVAVNPTVNPVAVNPVAVNPTVNPVAVNPVAVNHTVNPVAVNPVAVNPVAVNHTVNPVAVNPVAVNPVAVNPVAVNPVAVNHTVNPVAVNPVATNLSSVKEITPNVDAMDRSTMSIKSVAKTLIKDIKPAIDSNLNNSLENKLEAESAQRKFESNEISLMENQNKILTDSLIIQKKILEKMDLLKSDNSQQQAVCCCGDNNTPKGLFNREPVEKKKPSVSDNKSDKLSKDSVDKVKKKRMSSGKFGAALDVVSTAADVASIATNNSGQSNVIENISTAADLASTAVDLIPNRTPSTTGTGILERGTKFLNKIPGASIAKNAFSMVSKVAAPLAIASGAIASADVYNSSFGAGEKEVLLKLVKEKAIDYNFSDSEVLNWNKIESLPKEDLEKLISVDKFNNIDTNRFREIIKQKDIKSIEDHKVKDVKKDNNLNSTRELTQEVVKPETTKLTKSDTIKPEALKKLSEESDVNRIKDRLVTEHIKKGDNVAVMDAKSISDTSLLKPKSNENNVPHISELSRKTSIAQPEDIKSNKENINDTFKYTAYTHTVNLNSSNTEDSIRPFEAYIDISKLDQKIKTKLESMVNNTAPMYYNKLEKSSITSGDFEKLDNHKMAIAHAESDAIKQLYKDNNNHPISGIKINSNVSSHIISTPEGIKPIGIKSEAVTPEGIKPEAVTPEGIKPEAVTPEGVKPEAVTPEVVTPEGVKPEGIKPEAVTPEGIKPEGIKPEGIKPIDIKPEAVTPIDIKPEGIKPEGITPKDIKPEAANAKLESSFVAGIHVVDGKSLTPEQVMITDVAKQMGNKTNPKIQKGYDLAKGVNPISILPEITPQSIEPKITQVKSDNISKIDPNVANIIYGKSAENIPNGKNTGDTIINNNNVTTPINNVSSVSDNSIPYSIRNEESSINKLFASRLQFY